MIAVAYAVAYAVTLAGISHAQAPGSEPSPTEVPLVTANATRPPSAADAPPTAPLSWAGIELSQAEFAPTGEVQLPGPATVWQTVALPDSWRQMKRDRSRLGWYRLRFDLANAPEAPQAIYISRITNNIALYVNGVLLGVSGDLAAREMSWNVAQLFVVPPQMLNVGRNEILIRLHPDQMARAGLARVHIGEEADVRTPYNRRIMFQSTAPKIHCRSPRPDGIAVDCTMGEQAAGNGIWIFCTTLPRHHRAPLAHFFTRH